MNRDTTPMHVYYIQFTPGGRLEVGPLLASEDVLFSGLKPGQEEQSYRFPLAGRPELVETRIFAVPDHVRQMVSPPSFNSRAIMRFDESAREEAEAVPTDDRLVSHGDARPTACLGIRDDRSISQVCPRFRRCGWAPCSS